MSLAALKAELDKKRKANAPIEDAAGGNKYIRRGELEKLQHQAKQETKVSFQILHSSLNISPI
jgi:flagellar motility protein MotE (MotC chaperone)